MRPDPDSVWDDGRRLVPRGQSSGGEDGYCIMWNELVIDTDPSNFSERFSRAVPAKERGEASVQDSLLSLVTGGPLDSMAILDERRGIEFSVIPNEVCEGIPLDSTPTAPTDESGQRTTIFPSPGR